MTPATTTRCPHPTWTTTNGAAACDRCGLRRFPDYTALAQAARDRPQGRTQPTVSVRGVSRLRMAQSVTMPCSCRAGL
ncbi:DUF6255 family natural product biosynthesis protein [Streptomyces netropsis]|uniref:Uncharacterized protein n=1 Tax=Streptomyces netropsis TaxID=55404 RepID=A0A7W7PGK4_STRNE|nr:DUF6255 family natural product biosynthesis protein [Streptomyces netropsis]MBB4888333.1 hypothetical protein [Streptomyces netropsis]GGR30014.1 hypothetical protein GCM10010219_38650 [Streptomyces netropsis]